MFRRSRYSENNSFDFLREKLAAERALSESLFLVLTTSVDDPIYESRLFEAIDAYVRSRSTPIVGT